MPKAICDTFPLQYLHQVELLHVVAHTLSLKLTGTLGILIDAKRMGMISSVEPWLNRLQALRFHLAQHTRDAVLKLAGEEPS